MLIALIFAILAVRQHREGHERRGKALERLAWGSAGMGVLAMASGAFTAWIAAASQASARAELAWCVEHATAACSIHAGDLASSGVAFVGGLVLAALGVI